MRIYSFIDSFKMCGVFEYVLIILTFKRIPLLMPYFYLSFSFKSDYKFRNETIPLICSIIPILKTVSVIDKLFPDIIFQKSSDDL